MQLEFLWNLLLTLLSAAGEKFSEETDTVLYLLKYMQHSHLLGLSSMGQLFVEEAGLSPETLEDFSQFDQSDYR